MRPAAERDRPAIAALIRARAAWMRTRALRGWEGWRDSAEDLAAQAGDDAYPVWVATVAGTALVAGVTSLYEEASPLLWPDDDEREQPSIFLATTVTDPTYAEHRPGTLMAWWALDHAARRGRMWVRRGTGPYPGLVAYYRDVQGWRVARTVEHQGVTAYALERRAQLQPQLPSLGMALS